MLLRVLLVVFLGSLWCMGAGTLTVHNGGGAVEFLAHWYEFPTGGGGTNGGSLGDGSLAAGQTWSYGPGGSHQGYSMGWSVYCGGQWHQSAPTVNTFSDATFEMSGCAFAGAPAPVYYQVWTGVGWTNTTGSDVTLGFGWEGSSTNGAGVRPEGFVLEPGNYVYGMSFTNVGTGATGYFVDSRTGNILANLGSGSQYSSGSASGGYGAGTSGSGSVVPVVGGAHGGAGGSTNGASQSDIYYLGAQLGRGNADVVNAIRGLGTNLSNGLNTTGLATEATSAGTKSTLQGMSNMLSGVTGLATNTVGGMSSSATNADYAGTAGTNGLGGGGGVVASGVPSFLSSLGSAPTFGTGDGAGLSFAFCGTTLDLNPNSVMGAGFMDTVKAVWTFILLVGFAVWAANLLWDASKLLGAVETGGVPNMETVFLGTGGNVAGVVVAVTVATAFLALWIGLFTYVFGEILSQMGLVPGATAGLSFGGNQLLLYLMNAMFPVSLFFSLLWTRITVLAGAAKLVLFASAASRFLLGK